MKKIIPMIVALVVAVAASAQQHSVLAEGSWWRLRVNESGVYRLTVSQLAELQGVAVGKIGVYGGSGSLLSTYNNLTSTADMVQVPVEVVDRNGNGLFDADDELLFYGEGPDEWRFDGYDDRWKFQSHPYASDNSYYLTTTLPSGTTALRIERRTVVDPSAADTVISTHTALTHIDNDLVSPFETGQLWMGEKFSAANPDRHFSLTLPATSAITKIRYALASVSVADAQFKVEVGSSYSSTHRITSSGVYASQSAQFEHATQSYDVHITYQPSEATAEGYLDYIELSARVPMVFGGGQMMVRNDQHPYGSARFTMSGGEGVSVWNVTDVNRVYAVEVSGGQWADSVGKSSQYVVFDRSTYLSPAEILPLDNQDLHGAPQSDYVVVTLPDYIEQAQRLAALHSVLDDYSTLVVTDQQVYNEYSTGKQDPMAIRSLLRSLRAAHPDAPPRYLVLFGKASYDNRNRRLSQQPTLVIYETPQSFDDEGGSYCSDDMLGYLDDNEFGTATQSLDVAIGRLPAKDINEARHLVDKVEHYIMKVDLADSTTRGDWRNYVALLSDDADPSKPGDTAFVHSSELTASDIKQIYPTLNIDRLYADAYHQQSGAIGSFYPDLNKALRQRMNYGCILINYIGHGSATYIGTERYMELSHIDSYTNTDRLPLFITSTCSYGHHDHPEILSGAEALALAPAAAIAVVSAARKIPHIHRFNRDVIINALDHDNTIGEALVKAKNRTAVSMSIGLIGDPALRLSVPENQIVVTHIDGHPVSPTADDTATTLSRVTIQGEIHTPDGQLLSDFDGTIFPIVFDREVAATTLANDNPGTEVAFSQQKSILYKGSEPVSRGHFEYSFIVPRDVSYQYAYGKLSHYAKSPTEDAAGHYSRLLFGGLNEDITIDETQRPEIRLFIGDTNFRNGGWTDCSPTLIALLADSVGINAVGSGLGHDITATLDGNASGILILNDFYQPDLLDSRKGSIAYNLTDIAPGEHTIDLKAWNIYNLSNTASITFRVADTSQFVASSLTCYPNPASQVAHFRYETNATSKITSATFTIYNLRGQQVTSCHPTISTDGYVVGPIHWQIPPSSPTVYIATLIVSTSDGETHRSSTKLLVR